MCENGRILHHLRNNIEDANNTILLVSFQAQDTLGRKLQDGVNPVRIFGQEHDVRAWIETIEGYSAHADQSELVRWASAFDPKRLQHIYLVHGEPQAANALQAVLKDKDVPNVSIPARGERVTS
jgi:metallo-beta-lactamase family protein